ncbi:MAG: hypothetical protein P1V20_31775, partial [Verrucomicrobiales bacterium]|nr:hypothetical protein [Verrucomicrobiales bacterium]
GLPGLDGESMEEMMEKLGMGRGGINRGRGDAPIFFGDEEDLKTNNIEGVSGTDLERAMPTDVLGIGLTEHDDEEKPSIRQAGGQLSNKASGGEAVWRESLMPEEKALLKRYFK